MTITLAIDTSTSRTSVAVVDDGVILWSGLRDGATEHGPAPVSYTHLTLPTIYSV